MQIILFKDLTREVEREFIDDSGQIYLGITFTYGLPGHHYSECIHLQHPHIYIYVHLSTSILKFCSVA